MRIFLTAEKSEKIPASLIRMSRMVMFERPSGVRASLERTFTNVMTEEQTARPPVERCRLRSNPLPATHGRTPRLKAGEKYSREQKVHV